MTEDGKGQMFALRDIPHARACVGGRVQIDFRLHTWVCVIYIYVWMVLCEYTYTLIISLKDLITYSVVKACRSHDIQKRITGLSVLTHLTFNMLLVFRIVYLKKYFKTLESCHSCRERFNSVCNLAALSQKIIESGINTFWCWCRCRCRYYLLTTPWASDSSWARRSSPY